MLLLVLLCCRRDKDEQESTDTWGDSASTWETDWEEPACDASGAAAVTWTSDQGESAAARAADPDDDTHTWSVVTLSEPGALAASHDGTLLRSDDGGCTWSALALPDGQNRHLLAADTLVYAWSPTLETIYRIEGETVLELASPDPELVGLGADPADPLHLRAGNASCDLYDSQDGGETWALHEAAPSRELNTTFVAFDPEDLDHVVCTLTGDGAFASFDGGGRWDRARGFQTKEAVNMFSAIIAPGDRDVVWAEGLRVEDTRRMIWRSDDGGITWFLGVEDGGEVNLDSSPPLAVHPAAPNVVAFSGGGRFYTYDARDDALSAGTPTPGLEVKAITASPAAPGIWYLGLDGRSDGP